MINLEQIQITFGGWEWLDQIVATFSKIDLINVEDALLGWFVVAAGTQLVVPVLPAWHTQTWEQKNKILQVS